MLRASEFILEPLGPQHNVADYAAWTSSIEHIRQTAGFTGDDWPNDGWPQSKSIDENLVDLIDHAGEFARREAFAYTMIDRRTGDVIGCVYIDPDDTGAAEAMVRCWVVASRLDDAVVADTVRRWVTAEWPFASVRFPGRS